MSARSTEKVIKVLVSPSLLSKDSSVVERRNRKPIPVKQSNNTEDKSIIQNVKKNDSSNLDAKQNDTTMDKLCSTLSSKWSIASTKPRRSKLELIFDIDETLIHWHSDYDESYACNRIDFTDCEGQPNCIYITKRPYLHEALRFCDALCCQVGIWSSADPMYVKLMVSYLFQGLRQPKVIYTAEHVSVTDDDEKQVYKPLSLLYEKEQLKPEHTLIVDDREFNFRDNPDNGILITKFEPDHVRGRSMSDDDQLQRLCGALWYLKDKFSIVYY